MKITVAFYGIPRCTAVSAPSIERCLLAPLRAMGDVSVASHLWRIERLQSMRSGEDGHVSDDAYGYFAQYPGVIDEAEAFEAGELFGAWKSFGDDFNDRFGSLRNLMHQLQSLKRVTEMVRHTDPDIVVFARPDLQYHDAIPGSACRFVAKHPNSCAVPIWNWWGGFNDRFAICGREAYEAYGMRLERAIDFARRGPRPIHSESLLKFALREAGVRTVAIPLRASRVRLDGMVKQENFDALRTSTRNTRLWRDPVGKLSMLAVRWWSRRAFADASWDAR